MGGLQKTFGIIKIGVFFAVLGAREEVSSIQPFENASFLWGSQCTADLLYEGRS